jgi:hypothetical protein
VAGNAPLQPARLAPPPGRRLQLVRGPRPLIRPGWPQGPRAVAAAVNVLRGPRRHPLRRRLHRLARSTPTAGTPTGYCRHGHPCWPPKCCTAAAAWGSGSAAPRRSAMADPARSRSPLASSARPCSRSTIPSPPQLLLPP